jgi:hypothetical protein
MEGMVPEAKEEFKKIIEFVTRDALTWEYHSVEGEIFRRLLKMGQVLLMLFVRSVGTGHAGPTLTTEGGSVLLYPRTSPRKSADDLLTGWVQILDIIHVGDTLRLAERITIIVPRSGVCPRSRSRLTGHLLSSMLKCR